MKEYVCVDCGDIFTFDDFMFESLANPYSCPDCERNHWNEALDN